MSKRYLFPSELPLEATSVSVTADWLSVQISGESYLRKAHPSVITTATGGWKLLAPGNTGANPTYAHQNDTDTGICFYAANTVGFASAGAARCGVGSSGNFVPLATNTYSCGTSASRWTELWTTNGASSVSDANEKTDVADCDLGLDFVLALRPVKYRWINRGNTVTPVLDADGLTTGTVLTPAPGVRYHYGLIAQEVAAALGDHDFAGYIDDAETGTKGLRYNEFIAPLIAAIQALAARVNALENSG